MHVTILLNPGFPNTTPCSYLPHSQALQAPRVTVSLHGSPVRSLPHNALSRLVLLQPLASTLPWCPAGMSSSSWLPVSGMGPVGWAGFCSWTTAVVSALSWRMSYSTLWSNHPAEGCIEGCVCERVRVGVGGCCWVGTENL